MSEVIDMKNKTPRATTNEVHRLDMHDSVPTLVNSKTISPSTYRGKMTYLPEWKVIKFEDGGKITGYMPDTNVKFIWMK